MGGIQQIRNADTINNDDDEDDRMVQEIATLGVRGSATV